MKKCSKEEIEKYFRGEKGSLFPPGADGKTEVTIFCIWLFACVMVSFQFFFRYAEAYRGLFYWEKGERFLYPGAYIGDYTDILGKSLIGFPMLILLMALFAGFHYYLYHMESKSIYLIKRLPDRRYLWKTCVNAPLIGTLVTLAVMGLLFLLYLLFYRAVTPPECLRAVF